MLDKACLIIYQVAVYSGSYLFRGPWDQTVDLLVSFTIENGPSWGCTFSGNLDGPSDQYGLFSQ